MSNDHFVSEFSSFCKGCSGEAELKVMCPMFDTSSPGYTCVSLFHCQKCINYKGIDLEKCKINCSYSS